MMFYVCFFLFDFSVYKFEIVHLKKQLIILLWSDFQIVDSDKYEQKTPKCAIIWSSYAIKKKFLPFKATLQHLNLTKCI